MDPQVLQPEPIAPESTLVQSETVLVQPISSSPKSKLPLIFGMIVLLGIVGVVGILLGKNLTDSKTPVTVQPVVTVTTSTPTPTPTVDPTADWKTYINSVYKFDFKYPNNYLLSDKNFIATAENNKLKSLSLIKDINKETGQPPIIYFQIINTAKTMDNFINDEQARLIADWQEWKQASGLNPTKPEIISSNQIQINQIQIIKVEKINSDTAPNNKETQYLFKKDGSLYLFSVNYGTLNPDTKEDGTEEKNVLDQIISTARFTP